VAGDAGPLGCCIQWVAANSGLLVTLSQATLDPWTVKWPAGSGGRVRTVAVNLPGGRGELAWRRRLLLVSLGSAQNADVGAWQ
jgi:hypothetical protein